METYVMDLQKAEKVALETCFKGNDFLYEEQEVLQLMRDMSIGARSAWHSTTENEVSDKLARVVTIDDRRLPAKKSSVPKSEFGVERLEKEDDNEAIGAERSRNALKGNLEEQGADDDGDDLIERGPITSKTRPRGHPYSLSLDSAFSSDSSQDLLSCQNGSERNCGFAGGSVLVNTNSSVKHSEYPATSLGGINNRRIYIHQTGGNCQPQGKTRASAPNIFTLIGTGNFPASTTHAVHLVTAANGDYHFLSSEHASPESVTPDEFLYPTTSSTSWSDNQEDQLVPGVSPPNGFWENATAFARAIDVACDGFSPESVEVEEYTDNYSAKSNASLDTNSLHSLSPQSCNVDDAIVMNPLPDALAKFIDEHSSPSVDDDEYRNTLSSILGSFSQEETAKILHGNENGAFLSSELFSELEPCPGNAKTTEDAFVEGLATQDMVVPTACLDVMDKPEEFFQNPSPRMDASPKLNPASPINCSNGKVVSGTERIVYVSQQIPLVVPLVIVPGGRVTKKERLLAPKPAPPCTAETVGTSLEPESNAAANPILTDDKVNKLREALLKGLSEDGRRRLHCAIEKIPDEGILEPDDDGDTPLHVALLQTHNIPLSVMLIDKYARLGRLDVSNKSGQTILLLAILAGNRDVVRYLLAKGADPNVHSCKNGDTVLHALAGRGSSFCDVLEMLCSHPDIKLDAFNNSGQTPLMVAVNSHGMERCVGDREGKVVLDSSKVLKLLLKYKASTSKQELTSGKTVYHLAVEKKSLPLLQILCRENPSVCETINVPTFEGNTPLHYAAGQNNCNTEDQMKIVQLLIANGASLLESNLERKLPVDLVEKAKKKSQVKSMLAVRRLPRS